MFGKLYLRLRFIDWNRAFGLKLEPDGGLGKVGFTGTTGLTTVTGFGVFLFSDDITYFNLVDSLCSVAFLHQ